MASKFQNLTFADYNKDDIFNDNASTAEELVQKAYNEGVSEADLRNSLSPKWKEDKKGNVEKAIKARYGNASTNVPEESVVKENLTTEKPSEINLTPGAQQRQDIINSANELATKATETAQKDIEDGREKANEMTEKTVDDYISSGLKKIPDYGDDKVNTLLQYYKRDGLGKVGSKDAKIRLGYLIVNNLASGLKQMSNNFAAAAGRSPAFTDTESDWNKIKRTNLEEGLKSSWTKKKALQDEAIKILNDNATTTSEMTQALRLWNQNSKLQNVMAGMTEEQKKNTLLTLAKAGDYINKLSPEQLVGFIEGAIVLENMDATKALAVLGGKAAGSAINGGILETITDATAGISGGSGDKQILDTSGKPFKLSTIATAEEKQKFNDAVNALYDKYKNGKITKEQFIEQYTPYINAAQGHPSLSKMLPENAIKAMDKGRIDKAKKQIKELNDKKGKIPFDDYNKEYDKILENFAQTGGNPADLAKEKRITKAWVLRAPSK